MSSATFHARGAAARMSGEEKRVIFASSLGTVFEWYDFYLYGALAPVIAAQFFGGLDPQASFVFALLAFAAGFVVRPFGALVFGRLGDMIGRKYTFLVTILIMGLSTFVVGLLPGYVAIGAAAPVLLIILRMLQGLAMGGEYGGAATYVAEHAPQGRRGEYTSWIQTTATLGLLLSLVVILGARTLLGEAAFADWGWRLPFLLSIVLLAVSVWIRLSMNESPAFRRIKEAGRASKAPVSESFGRWSNLKVALLALFGVVAGQAVVWYTGQFYVLLFLTNVLRVDGALADVLVITALVLGAPFFVLFGVLSDRIGRKPIILTGLLLAALTYFPLFKGLTAAANPALATAQATTRTVVHADPATCSFQANPVAREVDFTSGCDIARRVLAQNAATYRVEAIEAGRATTVQVGERGLTAPVATATTGGHRFDQASVRAISQFRSDLEGLLREAGYPMEADSSGVDHVRVVLILTVLVLLVAMVYGPLAATLVELFPTRIRYTSLSLPYHIGNGWFGGLMPTIAFAMVASRGDIYAGLWYPVVVASVTFVIGLFLLPETRHRDIFAAD